MLRTLKLSLAVGLVFAIGIGCDTSGPTAPEDPPSPLLLTLTASPTSVETGEQSMLTVTGSRTDTTSVEGTSVALTTDLGALSASNVTLDAQGAATVTFTAPDSAGTATITAVSDQATASVTVAVTSDVGQVAVAPGALDHDYSRAGSPCPDTLSPMVAVSNTGVDAIDFRVVDDLPPWLKVMPSDGSVPGSLEALFTCDVGTGDLDLTHEVRVQGTDPLTLGDVGDEVVVMVTVRVRD